MAKIYYYATGEDWRKEQKFKFLDEHETVSKIDWQEITPDKNHNWLNEGISADFENFLPIGDKVGKADDNLETAIFNNYSRGIESTRDNWTFNFNETELINNILTSIDTYNDQVYKWHNEKRNKRDLDSFVLYDDTKIKWSSSLKENLLRGKVANYEEEKLRKSVYRPFTKQILFFDELLIHRRGQFPNFFPTIETERENCIICTNGIGSNKSFQTLITSGAS